MADITDDDILSELGLDAAPKKESKYSPEEARIIAGFEDILRFAEEHGHKPEHGEDKDIFERLYAVRLDRIRGNAAYRELVKPLDTHRLLYGAEDDVLPDVENLDDDALLAELGMDVPREGSITNLTHVKPRADIQAAEDVANRMACKDFGKFKPLFEAVRADLDTGKRETRPFGKDAAIEKGEFFILSGQMAYVANVGAEERRTKDARPDRRLRVIFDNATESDLLMRSLQRALYKDESGRRIIDPNPGPLFGGKAETDDSESGTIYVLRSKSDLPLIAQGRDSIHKIGVTGGDVEARIANAEQDPTFLFAAVEVVATYKLFNINRAKLENVLHRFFSRARLDFEIPDRFGNKVKPREWFLVPITAIDETVKHIREGTIGSYLYDPKSADLKRV
ncbi:GIY-YIG nuclease family protein [Hyphomicrobium sp. DY-1]|uniref:GIY-YIG nuclease family protein n=1 Tax=Hyphomicrobium sp. DY-1 TaxID=3075650 RepID=UPI0039C4DB85